MTWLKPLNPRGEASAGDNNDTQAAWLSVVQGQASGTQIADARKVFARHLGDISLSLAGYHAVNYTLPDGSRMRVVSNSGIHQVMLWPVGAAPIPKLPHGFAVKTNWGPTRIFKRRTGDTVTWALDPTPVPQLTNAAESTNQVFRANSAETYFVHPMVLSAEPKRALWDYLKHASQAPTATSPATPIVPICLAIGSAYKSKPVHYCKDNTIVDEGGTVRYTMSVVGQILDEDPETPQFLPASTDAIGSRVALQHTRQALVSPSAGITFFRTCNEVIRRTATNTYEAVSRAEATTSVPLDTTGSDAPLIVSGIATFPDGTAELTGPVGLFFMYGGTSGTGSAQWFDPDTLEGGLGAFVAVLWGFVEGQYDLIITPTISGSTEIRTINGPTNEVLSGLIALPTENGFFSPDITVSLHYPVEVYWRGGTNQAEILNTEAVLPSYGTDRYRKVRVDTRYDMAATPYVSIDLEWVNLTLFGGTATSEMDGQYHVNYEYVARDIAIVDDLSAYDYVLVSDDAGFPTFGTVGDMAAWYASNEANNLLPELLGRLADYPYPGVEQSEVTANIVPTNEGSYEFTSRHIIDYDHKGQFYAAILVEVSSSGARWDGTGGYWGDMVLTSEADYVVTISLETRWKGITNATELVTATCTRPPFEFPSITKANVLTEATGSGSTDPITVHTPPVISPPIEFFEQLKAMAGHQGVNPHLACADVRPDIVGDAATRAASKAGIEFSVGEGGGIRPHTKYATGQLYARTFKLSDFPDALWLLHATKCDASENDAGGAPYFYMPDIATALDVDNHVEVRDGVHEQWSDEIFPGTDQPADPLDREINLYRV